MKRCVSLISVGVMCLGLSSCFLITVPVKAAGEIIERGAYATRDLTAAGIRKARESRQEGEYESYDEGATGYGSDEYYEQEY